MTEVLTGPSCEGVPRPLVDVLHALRTASCVTSSGCVTDRKVPCSPLVAAAVTRLMLGFPPQSPTTKTAPVAMPEKSEAAEDMLKDCFVNAVMSSSSEYSKHTDDMVWLVTNHHDDAVSTAATVQQLHQQHNSSLNGPEFLALKAMHVAVLRRHSGANDASTETSPTGSRRRSRSGSSGRATGTLYFPTVGLNLVCQWVYTLTIAVVRVIKMPEQPGKHAMVATSRHVRRVFAAPYKGHLRDRHDATSHDVAMVGSIDYPMIHINLDDYEDYFTATRLTPGHHLAVLLVPGASEKCDAAAFRGVVSYEGVMGKVQSKYVPPSSPTKKPKALPLSPSGTVCTQEGTVFIPLSASAGFGEVAVTVVNPPVPVRAKESPLSAVKSVTRKLFSVFASPDKQQAQPASSPNLTETPSSPLLAGTETLNCSLMNLRINICHILSVMLTHATNPPPDAEGDLPWMIVPDSPAELQRWLDLDDVGKPAPTS